jgi:hypothetical protein
MEVLLTHSMLVTWLALGQLTPIGWRSSSKNTGIKVGQRIILTEDVCCVELCLGRKMTMHTNDINISLCCVKFALVTLLMLASERA